MADPQTVRAEAERLARQFHDVYERLAPSFGYETRQETRAFDSITPNGRLMIAVCAEVGGALRARVRREALEPISEAHAALRDYFVDWGGEHELEGCPMDDTCACPMLLRVNAPTPAVRQRAWRLAQGLLRGIAGCAVLCHAGDIEREGEAMTGWTEPRYCLKCGDPTSLCQCPADDAAQEAAAPEWAAKVLDEVCGILDKTGKDEVLYPEAARFIAAAFDAQAGKLVAEVRAARELLAEIEWAGEDKREPLSRLPCCPNCGGWPAPSERDGHPPIGHTADCLLAALLGKADGV